MAQSVLAHTVCSRSLWYIDQLYWQGSCRKDLYDSLKLATTGSSFIFDNKLYKQIDGVLMGWPLGPTMANTFLCHYKKFWLNECPS